MASGTWHQGEDGRCVGCGVKLSGSASCVDCAAAAMADRHIPALDNPRGGRHPVSKPRPAL